MNALPHAIDAAPTSTPRSFARHLPAVGRCVLGLAFFVFGLDGFLHFFPVPADPGPAGAVAFAVALGKTGYLFQLVKGTELVAGALLLSNRFVPLALTLLAPVIVNILAFHAFLAPATVAPGLIVAALEIALAVAYRSSFRAVLAPRAAPGQ